MSFLRMFFVFCQKEGIGNVLMRHKKGGTAEYYFVLYLALAG